MCKSGWPNSLPPAWLHELAGASESGKHEGSVRRGDLGWEAREVRNAQE